MTLSPLRLRLVVTSLLVVSLLGALDHTVVATALGTIAGSLGALEQMSLIVVSYTLASAVVLPLLGKLGDLTGARRVYLASVALFLISSLACGFADSIWQLVIARTVQGVSSAGMQLMSQTIVAMVTTPRQRPRILSIIGAACPVAILIGPLLGGLITDLWGWRWVFWVNIPVGLVALLLALATIPTLPGATVRRFDAPGALTLSAAMVSLVGCLTWIGHPGRLSLVLGTATLSVVCWVLFLWVERRAVEPLVPLGLLRERTVAAGTALSAIIGIGLFSVVSFIPTYVQLAFRTSATVSGSVPIATVFGMLVASLFTGWRVSRTGRYRVFPILGCAVAALGLGAMALLPDGVGLWVPMVLMALVGIGTGAFMSLITAVVQSAVPRSATGSITATANLVRQLGATLGTAVIGGAIGAGAAAGLPAGIDASTFTPAQAQALPTATQELIAGLYSDLFGPVFAALGGVYAVGLLVAVLLPARLLPDEPQVVDTTSPSTVAGLGRQESPAVEPARTRGGASAD